MTRPLVKLSPFDPARALTVLSGLDDNDQLEAQIMRGDPAESYDLLTDWLLLARQGAACYVGEALPPISAPFAVLALVPGTTPGLGYAAMLARDHHFWKRALVPLVRLIRHDLPPVAAHMGLHRIEARSWAGHPTAATLLRAIGFTREAEMTGFGYGGEMNLDQWVWLADYIPPRHTATLATSKET